MCLRDFRGGKAHKAYHCGGEQDYPSRAQLFVGEHNGNDRDGHAGERKRKTAVSHARDRESEHRDTEEHNAYAHVGTELPALDRGVECRTDTGSAERVGVILGKQTRSRAALGVKNGVYPIHGSPYRAHGIGKRKTVFLKRCGSIGA